MNMRPRSSILLLSVALIFLLLRASVGSGSGFYHEKLNKITMATNLLGGIRESGNPSANSIETEEIGRFAVDEHNKKQNALLEFAKVVEAKEQVVAGTLHHLVIEAIEAGKKKLYEAKVWVKPWMNFKELQEFKWSRDCSPFSPSDLGVKRTHLPGWQDVASHDPSVQDAANHALQAIQQRSNSLFPYELQEIADAKAEVINESAKIQMVMKVKRGSTEEKLKVEVHRNSDGGLHLNHMEPHTE